MDRIDELYSGDDRRAWLGLARCPLYQITLVVRYTAGIASPIGWDE